MADEIPLVLELASLPREQVGPFLLLGLDKDAGKDEVEAHWAQRLIWARKQLVRVALEDVNWAREVLNDPDRRARADAGSLNADTAGQVLRRLAERYHVGESAGPGWQPRDVERSLTEYAPAAGVPDLDEVRQTVAVPEPPADLPGVAQLLEAFVREPLDPWNLNLPAEPAP